MKKKNYKGKIEDMEFEDVVKEYLLKHSDDSNYDALKAMIEKADQLGLDEKIDESKEKEIIEKLRRKTGITGIGLAGNSLLAFLLMGLNVL